MRANQHLSWLTAAAVLLFSLAATAEVPKLLHYQSYLTNADGEAIHCPDAVACEQQYNVTFQLYTQSEGGDAVWMETQEGVSINHGIIDVVLGQTGSTRFSRSHFQSHPEHQNLAHQAKFSAFFLTDR